VEFIISHGNTDFDSLASMVAAHKLYPQAQMVFTGKLSQEVKEFMSFYKDKFNIKHIGQVDVSTSTRLIMVDTALANRVGKFAEILDKAEVELHIYDHHVGNENLRGKVHFIEPLGATATMLVERIKEKGIELTPIEATVIALGIYGDTDCLTYSSTTARDVAAVAFLISYQANLKIIREFLGRPLAGVQRDILNELLSSLETYQIQGLKITLAKAVAEDYIDGLAALAAKVQDLENPDALFIVAQMGNRVHIVGRSKVKEVRINDILRPLGGGGHSKAASAAVKGKELEEVKDQLHTLLLEKVKPLFVARDIMSSPVKTIAPETSVREADSIMSRYGHTGLPIVDSEGRLKGIISRRDLDKAKRHGYLKLPVKGFMSSKVLTIAPDTTFQEIQKIIIQHDIGRLPVVEEDKLIGIVSRTDILRKFYEEEQEEETSEVLPWQEKNLARIMQARLPLEIQVLLQRIGQLAGEKPVFVVGGFVRDLLLGRRNLDIDLVVEGSGLEFAQYLAAELQGELTSHADFGTATVTLADGQKLDVATARREFYEYPAVLPTVETGSLKQDLYRRDFTINAMAVSLNPESYGELMDFFAGQQDLKKGIIRVLYNLSFIEDPTRIFRALRFEQRYNFRIEEQTAGFISHALKMGVLDKLSGTRLKNEFLLILKEKNPAKILLRSEDWGILSFIQPGLSLDQEIVQVLASAQLIINHFPQTLTEKEKILVYFLGLIHKIGKTALEEIATKLEFTKGDIETMLLTVDSYPEIEEFLSQGEIRASVLYQKLQGFSWSSLYFFLAKTKEYKVKKKIVYYLHKLKDFKAEMGGDDLLQLGYKGSPKFKRVLEKIKTARMDGKIKNREEELELAQSLMEQE